MMKKSYNNVKKSQASMEFLILCGIALFIFLILLGFYLFRKAEILETEAYLDKTSECIRLSNIISQVYAGEEGTEVIVNTNYLVSFFNYSMVSVEDIGDVVEEVNKSEIVSCIFYGEVYPVYELTGEISLKKEGGGILIENA